MDDSSVSVYEATNDSTLQTTQNKHWYKQTNTEHTLTQCSLNDSLHITHYSKFFSRSHLASIGTSESDTWPVFKTWFLLVWISQIRGLYWRPGFCWRIYCICHWLTTQETLAAWNTCNTVHMNESTTVPVVTSTITRWVVSSCDRFTYLLLISQVYFVNYSKPCLMAINTKGQAGRWQGWRCYAIFS